MSKAGATKDYKSGQKNNWRRTIWNEVLRRTAGRERDELILYLAGPQDLDRAIAVSKGVPSGNLIAIDRDQRNVDTTRSSGGLCVRADALDLLWSWPGNRRVCAVLLDFCSGIEYGNAAVYDAFERDVLNDAVIAVNFQRGRDPWSNQWRKGLADLGFSGALLNYDTETDRSVELVDDVLKHRGAQFLLAHQWQVASMLATGKAFPDGQAVMVIPESVEARQAMRLTICRLMQTCNKPAFYSYRSGSLVFDSAVFHHHGHVRRVLPGVPDWAKTVFPIAETRTTGDREREWSIKSVAHRIGATLAIRTKRAFFGTADPT